MITHELSDDPLWYKDAIIYELHVRAFRDSSGDGVGDFNGLIEKLDYLQDLGVTAIWLLPFYPSPLHDDGYDISDYESINPSYGEMRDFKQFLKEAHQRGLRVITELVINHTSSEHPWFQRARRSPPGSKYRDFYVWSDTPNRYQEARIIFQDFETSNWTWDPVANAYYWHRFYSHQPDLNFENPEVQKALLRTLDFWMKLGVDGMRLDAVPYLYEKEGTNCENLPETHLFLKKLRKYIDDRYDNRMILAEANQWPEDAAAYFGDGDECHMNFHFPVMPRMFMAVQLESNFPILEILEQTPPIPETCQWAVFLRNHDELTLEMVTDEDRDYMYRMYADDPRARINLGIRRRLAPLLKVRRKIELMNGMLLSLPGTPVLYYGDEIGMGDNIYLGDRNGVRTPMQWSADRNAGFSLANPQRLYLPVIIDPEHHFQAINVEAQQQNSASLLWWMKHLIALRKQYRVFGRGDLRFLHPENPKVLAFFRSYEGEHLLAVFNLSRHAQYVELDLSEFEGHAPVELFGRTEFPRIGRMPYLLTLGPHEFYWFLLEKPEVSGETEALVPQFDFNGPWTSLFAGRVRTSVTKHLLNYVRRRRWFRGKARKTSGLHVRELVAGPMPDTGILVLDVEYVDGSPETYLLPLKHATDEGVRALEEEKPWAVVAHTRSSAAGSNEKIDGVLHDALVDSEFARRLLLGFLRKSRTTSQGPLSWMPEKGLKGVLSGDNDVLTPHLLSVEQTNSSIQFGERVMFKLYRRVEYGQNPDLEIGRFLSQQAAFPHTPAVVGSLHYRHKADTAAIGLLQQFVPNQGDAWAGALDGLSRYFENALALRNERNSEPSPSGLTLHQRSRATPPTMAAELLGDDLHRVRLLGQRTAELHLALASNTSDPDFSPEPFSSLHQRALYQSGHRLLRQNMDALKKSMPKLPDAVSGLAKRVAGRRAQIDALLKRIVGPKIDTVRIRCHGDFHLGQVLYTGKDFVIIDFEGEPSRTIGERRLKRSALRDVAGMLRSFHYAATAALRAETLRREDVDLLRPWADLWTEWVTGVYLGAYLSTAAGAAFVPATDEQREMLIDFYLIEKCVYELGYELNNRPDWVEIPLLGIEDLLSHSEPS